MPGRISLFEQRDHHSGRQTGSGVVDWWIDGPRLRLTLARQDGTTYRKRGNLPRPSTGYHSLPWTYRGPSVHLPAGYREPAEGLYNAECRFLICKADFH